MFRHADVLQLVASHSQLGDDIGLGGVSDQSHKVVSDYLLNHQQVLPDALANGKFLGKELLPLPEPPAEPLSRHVHDQLRA